jgi:exodeoxyribonuclease V gamma subunit
MFYLHVSNRTENLLCHLAEVIRTDRQADFFAAELFLIQSQGMERMIGQNLADAFRSFCNFKFFLPLDFLGYVAEKLEMGITPDGFQRQILAWRLDGLLRDIAGEVYQPLTGYLEGENSALKRFQLARRLANIFDQYQIMRPDMLAKWERGLLATSHPAESWQMELWRRLLAQPGGEVHRGMLLRQVIERLKSEKKLADHLPKRISVLGLHTMPPVFLRFLNSLSNHMDVHLFLLSPCRGYWGNVQGNRMQYKSVVPKVVDREKEDHHPLLASLGRQGRDLQNMLLEEAAFALEFSSYDDPLDGIDPGDGTLLQRLQADLLEGCLPDGPPLSTAAADDSIRVVSCHSKLREITVLKDHLLHLLHSNPRLELRDIIVMAPDIQEYALLIPAVFDDIQHSIADRSIRGRNEIIAAFLKFLNLFNGRFGWSELLDLLGQPVVFPSFQLCLSDLDSLQQWVIRSGIRWGLSGRQRSEAGLADFEETSWRAGLDRLLMGYAIDTDEYIDGVLPFADIEGRGALALGGLCRFIELVEDAHDDFLHNRPLDDWSKLLHKIVQQLFGDENEQDLAELRTLIAELSESIGPFHTVDVQYKVIREWFTQSTKERRSSTGFLRGQLTFCSMLPMRSIPFQVVCLLGLCDGVFPKNDSHDTFDLMAADFRPGDRSPRGDDRYQFLEALLAARSHLYLSYIGQSIRTNEEIPPSVVVTEFLEVLDSGYGVQDLVVRHPLHPFSRKYFRGESGEKLFSYNDYACTTAKILQQGPRPTVPWWEGQLDEKRDTIAFTDLLRFYINPQKYFVRDCLGIRLNTGEELPEDREIFAVSGLGKYHVEEEILRAALSGKSADLLKKMQTAGLWPLGASGRLAYAGKENDVVRFIDRINEQQMGEKCVDLPFDFNAGDYRLFGTLANLYENGAMLLRFGRLRGRDLLAGWIHHLVLRILQPSAQTRIVAVDGLVVFKNVVDGFDEVDLASLLAHFDSGCRGPSLFFVEPAFVYARQAAGDRASTPPLEKALKELNSRLDNGYEPEWELLLGGDGQNAQFKGEFERHCEEIMCRILGAADA